MVVNNFDNEILFLSSFFGKNSFGQKELSFQEIVPSMRLQIKPAIEAAKQLGFKVRRLSLNDSNCLDKIGNPCLCIIGKLTSNPEKQNSFCVSNLASIVRLKRKGIPIILIYSDDWCSCKRNKLELDRSNLYKDLFYLFCSGS